MINPARRPDLSAPSHQLRFGDSGPPTLLDLLHVQVGLGGNQPSEVVRVDVEETPDRVLGSTDVEDGPSEVRYQGVVGPRPALAIG